MGQWDSLGHPDRQRSDRYIWAGAELIPVFQFGRPNILALGQRCQASPASERIAASTPPGAKGTPAVFIASSVVARQPSSIGSLRSPI